MTDSAHEVRSVPATTLILCVSALVAAAAAILLVPVVAGSWFQYQKFYNEGFNAYHSARVALGEPLYHPDLRSIVNYPYLSFYLSYVLDRLTGYPVFAERVVSLAAFGFVSIACAAWSRHMNASAAGAILSMATFVGFSAILVPGFVGADDPMFLAQALSMAGLLVHLDPSRFGLRRHWLSPLLLALALFTKHQMLAVPAAVLADVAVNERGVLVRWIATMTGMCAVLFGLGFLAGPDFLRMMLSPRHYDIYDVIANMRRILALIQLPLAASVLWFIAVCPRRYRTLFGTFGIVALGYATVFSGGAGVTRNIAIELIAWVSVGTGLAASEIARWKGARLLLPCAAIILFGFEIELAAFMQLGTERREFVRLEKKQQDFRADAEYLKDHAGDAICETMLLCFSAGKPLVMDPYNSREMVGIGRLPESIVVDPIRQRQIAVVQLDEPIEQSLERNGPNGSGTPARFTDTFLRALAENYRLDRTSSEGAFYRPIGAQ